MRQEGHNRLKRLKSNNFGQSKYNFTACFRRKLSGYEAKYPQKRESADVPRGIAVPPYNPISPSHKTNQSLHPRIILYFMVQTAVGADRWMGCKLSKSQWVQRVGIGSLSVTVTGLRWGWATNALQSVLRFRFFFHVIDFDFKVRPLM